MFFKIIKGLAKGKSLLRTLMNLELKNHVLHGRVLDVGGGESPSYFDFFKKEPLSSVENIDGKHNSINFEQDRLPYEDNSFEQVILCNVLEHIYNYKFLLSEIRRILKDDGEVTGFVPFLINYHPDPHDFFRYTKETLEKVFAEIGFAEAVIKEVGKGPFFVAFNSIMGLPFPRILKVIAFPFFYFPDLIALKFRSTLKKRYPLGFLFILKK